MRKHLDYEKERREFLKMRRKVRRLWKKKGIRRMMMKKRYRPIQKKRLIGNPKWFLFGESKKRVVLLTHYFSPRFCSQVSMQQLVNAGLHLGGHYSQWNQEMSQFVLGQRHSFYLISLSSSLIYLRRGLFYLSRALSFHRSVLFVSSEKEGRDYENSRIHRLGHYAVKGRYIPGTISNYRSVRLMRELPGVVCIADTKNCLHAVKECGRLQLPFFGYCDSEMDPRWFCFPIFGNNDSYEGTRLLFLLVLEGIRTGRFRVRQRWLKVFRRWNRKRVVLRKGR